MKSLVFLVLAFISTWVSAQHSTLDYLKADFERGKALSLAYIQAMPEDKFDYHPTEETMTFSEQMIHTAMGTFGLVSNGSGVENPYAGKNLVNDTTLHSKKEVLRLTEESFDFAIQSLGKMDPSTFDEVVVRGPFEVTRIDWINKAKEHTNHHRGQTAVYLRLSGVVPPQYSLF